MEQFTAKASQLNNYDLLTLAVNLHNDFNCSSSCLMATMELLEQRGLFSEFERNIA